MTVDDKALLEKAKAVRERAHAPYSNYYVGVAVLDENGRIHTGCNVENASYPEGPNSLKDSLQYIKGVGPKRAWLLSKLGPSG